MATWAADTFTRANSAVTLGTAEKGGAWTAHTGTWGISSNSGYGATPLVDALSYASLSGAPADVTVSADVTLSATSNRAGAGLLVRYTDGNNRIAVWLYKSTGIADALYVQQVLAGVETGPGFVGSMGLVNGSTYALKAVISGRTIAVYVNGVLRVAPVSFAAGLTTQKYGLSLHKGSVDFDDGGSRFDNFSITTTDRQSRMGRVLSS